MDGVDGMPPSPRTTVRRHAERGAYDRATVHAVLDEAPVVHVGVATERGPVVLPTVGARVDDTLYLHGAAGNAVLRAGIDGPVCATATLLDGLVLARSAFSHSMNYRSVVVFGTGRQVTDQDEKATAMTALVDHVLPGRSAGVRGPSDAELRATLVLALPLDEASAKVRTGPPIDKEEDLGSPWWAGVVPLRLVAGEPVPDEAWVGAPVPDHVRDYTRP